MTPALSLLSLVDGLDGENTKNLKIEEELFPEQLNARREEPDHWLIVPLQNKNVPFFFESEEEDNSTSTVHHYQIITL